MVVKFTSHRAPIGRPKPVSLQEAMAAYQSPTISAETRRCPYCEHLVPISNPLNGCKPWLAEHCGGKTYAGKGIRCQGSLTTAPDAAPAGLRGGL